MRIVLQRGSPLVYQSKVQLLVKSTKDSCYYGSGPDDTGDDVILLSKKDCRDAYL